MVIELIKCGHQVIGSGGRTGEHMKVLVTGVSGQLGHDVVNELCGCGCETTGSDIDEKYSGIKDGTAIVSVPYVQLDITNRSAVQEKIMRIHPDVIGEKHYGFIMNTLMYSTCTVQKSEQMSCNITSAM